MTRETLIALFVALGGAGAVWAVVRFAVIRLGRVFEEQNGAAARLEQLVIAAQDSARTPEPAAGLVERVEELERRMETVHKDCLRYLQRGEQALRTAEKARGERLEDEEPEQLPLQMPVDNQPEPVDDIRTWAREQVRARGENPIG